MKINPCFLHYANSYEPWRTTAFFYRTAAGAEIDLVLAHQDGSIRAIEIKRALLAKVRRGFHPACTDIKPSSAFAVHAGGDRYPVSETIEGIRVLALAEELRRLP